MPSRSQARQLARTPLSLLMRLRAIPFGHEDVASVRFRPPLWRALPEPWRACCSPRTPLTIASGSPIGREGSMLQRSAMPGSRIGLPVPCLGPGLACAVAADIAAAYDALISGALFASKIVPGVLLALPHRLSLAR